MSRMKARLAEFESILAEDVIPWDTFRLLCSNGIPDEPGIRPTCWRILLNYLPPKKVYWNDIVAQQRKVYQGFLKDFIIDTHKPLLGKQASQDDFIDPLGAIECTEGENKWTAYFKENEVLEQIDKDVKRLCPEFVFYKGSTGKPRPVGVEPLHLRVGRDVLEAEAVQTTRSGVPTVRSRKSSSDLASADDNTECHWEVIERILFIYAKLNPGISYVQGMNEVLGPLYYILASDPRPEWREHAEADTFFCFTSLMSEIRDNFIKTLDKSETGIGAHLNSLMKQLTKYDSEVATALETMQLQPQFFAFRWISLLLSQEFALPDVVRIWDTLFSAEVKIDYMLCLCVGMICLVREKILLGDFADTMKLLQNYPHDIDISQIIAKANSINDQELHEKKHDAFIRGGKPRRSNG